MQYTRSFLRSYILITVLLLFFDVDHAQDLFILDSVNSAKIDQVLSRNISVADVDNDGLQDIILSGFDDLNRDGLFLDIYSVTGPTTIDTFQMDVFDPEFDENIGFAKYIGGNGGMDLSDFDRDGWIDILLHGSKNLFLSKNLGGNSFSSNNYIDDAWLINTDLRWGDVDMDGDLDIILIGILIHPANNQEYIINVLLLNNGGTFDGDPNMVMPSLHNGGASWGDIDLDGDPDLIISGQSADPLSGVTRLYKNDPIGRLAEDTNQELLGLKGTAICFADLDQDSDPDLILSGWSPMDNDLRTIIYVNEPTGTFRPADQQIDFGTVYGTIEASDLDLDGWVDIAISGVTEHAMIPDSTYDLVNPDTTELGDTLSVDTLWQVTFHDTVIALGAKIFINNGDLSFTESQSFPGARTLSFCDIDQDSAPDLILSGSSGIGNRDSTFCQIYLNTTTGFNTRPAPPGVLEAFAVSDRAIFNWSPGTDDHDPEISLRYNVRIGTGNGTFDLLSSAVPFNTTNLGTRHVREFKEIAWGDYYWSVQTVDATGLRSDWSDEERFFIPRLVSSTQSLPGVVYGSSKWADINEDGNLDLAITGQLYTGASVTKLFMNDNGLLTPVSPAPSIQSVYGGHISFADYNNDGHLDLTLSGLQIYNFAPNPATLFYVWENGIYIEDLQSAVPWLSGGSNNHDWGDYDNDGDLDLVVGGGDYDGLNHLDIFTNNNGTLTLDTSQSELVPIYPCLTNWNDIDRDGHMDLVTVGGGILDPSSPSDTTLFTQAYINNGSGKMIRSADHYLDLGVTAGSIALGDYNSDGYDDIALAGKNNTNDEIITLIIRNDNGEGFVEHQVLQGIFFGEVDWGDYDNDGDLDLIASGLTDPDSEIAGDFGSDPVTMVYEQNSGYFSSDTTLSTLDSTGISSTMWGDYDLDGDLDLFLTGRLQNRDFVAKVYDNLESINNANNVPGKIMIISNTVHQDSVTLGWQAPIDPGNAPDPLVGNTPGSGLRYLLQMGGDLNYDLSANTHSIISGNYGVGHIGSITGTDRTIIDIPEGRYQWRVRAMDHSRAHSDWSDWDYFYIDLTPPVVDTIQANYGVSGQIILVIGFEEEFEMDDLSLDAEPHIVVTNPDIPDIDGNGTADTLDVIKQSYSARVWTGLLTLPDDYVGRAIEIHISNATDKRGNVMVQETVFKTPEKVISQFGGTAISADGQVSVLLPQNAVNEDVSITINPVSSEVSLSAYVTVISGYYDIDPSDITLNKPVIIRMAIPDLSVGSDTTLNPFIGYMVPDDPLPQFLGGSIIRVNDRSFLQAQLSHFGRYATFITDSSLSLDSLNTDILKCYPRIFSPAGSVFEFPSTNILFDLSEADDVTARIFNLSGRIKRTLNSDLPFGPGHNVLVWDGKDMDGKVVPSGLYIVTLERSGPMLRTTVGVLNR